MSSIRRTVCAVLTAATLFTVAACGTEGDGKPASPSASETASAGPGGKLHLPTALPSGLLDGLPKSWDELKKWKYDDWDRWASKHIFNNPVVRDLWNPDRMKGAQPQQPEPPATPPPADSGVTDPDPAAVNAVAVARPYTRFAASGKVFFNAPNGGTGQCSATVIADPAHPGKSNLVWTAGHCVHEGKGGDWFKNIIFVPAYNSSGAASAGRKATVQQVAPLGQWWADNVITSPQWTAEGSHSGNAANQYDFAVLKVHNPDGGGKSLEETVGTAMPVWFDAPRDQLSVSAWGYPAVKPFDGQELDRCDGGKPVRLSFDPKRPSMMTIGCTMTAGSSGGGWFATMPDGRQALVSNTSIGTLDHTSLSGPYLESVARQALDYISKK
ncbi:trypsin-like peptidase domain-containing protein [Kitasatospora sp. GP82]|uniref:trypsin-like serine peptidase n=1 Tax=Kitasatospora sp. GP82 TaxID=3035089 RepID=UPI002472EE92|nr:trypsin-like peptidase domain-containing protein [Kitasatospora sp. GP82]MDH6127721.1 V8-like Glu-specific endopeptidase [Kitasatospora sp. GP82]